MIVNSFTASKLSFHEDHTYERSGEETSWMVVLSIEEISEIWPEVRVGDEEAIANSVQKRAVTFFLRRSRLEDTHTSHDRSYLIVFRKDCSATFIVVG